MRVEMMRKENILHLGANGSHWKMEGHHWKAEI